MPQKKGSKALHERFNRLGELASNIKKADLEICSLEKTLESRKTQINELNIQIAEKNVDLELAQALLTNLTERHTLLSQEIIDKRKGINKITSRTKISNAKISQSKIKESGVELHETTLRRRRTATWDACKSIHGSSQDSIVYGLLDTLGYKCKPNFLAPKLLHVRPQLTKVLTENVLRTHTRNFYVSEENALRSLNVYYCSNVLGKNKHDGYSQSK